MFRSCPLLFLLLVLFLVSLLLRFVSSLYFHISPYPSTYTLSPLYRLCTPTYPRTLLHIPSTPLYRLCTPIYPRTLLHIPSTPVYRLCTPIYPCTLLHIPSTPLYRLYTPIYPRTLLHIPSTALVSSLYSHISLCPSTYTLYSLVSSSYSHISPDPSTYTLYSLVSSLHSHVSPHLSTYPLYSLASSLFSHISPYLLHITSTPLYRLCTLIYPYGFLDIPLLPFFLSSYNTLNEFAGQRFRKFLGKITEQAILSSWSFKEVINKRPCS